MADEVHPRLMPIFEPLCVPAWATLTAPTSDRGSSRFETGVLRISTAFYWLPPRLRLLLRRSNHFFSSGCSMSWKIATGIVLAATFSVAPASLFAQTCQDGSCIQQEGDWKMETTPGSVHAFTGSSAAGVLSYMCMPGKPGCQWAVIMPEADCAIGSQAQVSIAGDGGSLIVDALCKDLPHLNGMPGRGRILMFAGPEQLLTQAVVGRDVTISTRNANRRFIQHTFSGQGSALSVGRAYKAHYPSSSPKMSVGEKAVQRCISGVLEAPPNPGPEAAEVFCRCVAREMGGQPISGNAQSKARDREVMQKCSDLATKEPPRSNSTGLYPPAGTYIGNTEQVINASKGRQGK